MRNSPVVIFPGHEFSVCKGHMEGASPVAVVLAPGFGAEMAVGAVLSSRRMTASARFESLFGGCVSFFVRTGLDVAALVFAHLEPHLGY